MVQIHEIVFKKVFPNFIYIKMFLSNIIFLPLLGSFFTGFGGKIIGRKGSVILSNFCIFLCFLEVIIIFYKVIFLNKQYYLILNTWVDSGLFFCNWGFIFDSLTVVMLLVVLSISLLVHLYSGSYMEHDPHLPRFLSYLSLFTFFMLMLVTSDNFLQMFVGWEGVGFCSYLLINFWYTRLQANKAAIKAMLVNRISDFALVLGLLIIFIHFKSIEYTSVFASVPLMVNYLFTFMNCKVSIVDTASLLLFIGAMGKSAQLFLHTWLPDAMEGPTPVSALIHAATMVTAGVFLLARASPLFEYSSMILNLIIIIGAMTAFFAGTVGLVQNDLKKVIAYSTCSQLGYMVFACGVSNYQVGIFHLFNHAFFKALLFLSSGSVIHALQDEQDMRKMGGLRRILPYTYIMFVIGSLSLMGFPFLTGFYSKDVVLEVAYSCHNLVGHFAYWLGTIAAFCTAFYSTRLIYLTFLIKTNTFKHSIKNAHDAPFRMALPLSLLAFCSIFFGFIFRDMFIGLGSDFWGNSIFISPYNINLIDAEFLPVFIKHCPVICSMGGLALAIYFFGFNMERFYGYKTSDFGIFLYNFLNRKWFFDKVYNEYFIQFLLTISYKKTYKLIDKGIIEIFGPFGFSFLIINISKKLSKLHTGFIYNSSIILLFNLIIILIYIVIALNI
jgi:proton-translocating NADH-quinone oxidoreductase chain L